MIPMKDIAPAVSIARASLLHLSRWPLRSNHALLSVIRAEQSTPKRARYRAVKSASFSGFHSSAPAFQLAFETLQPVSAVPCSRTTGWPHS
jgi:hypothetical protein